jgi:hypothetical protein
MELRSSRRCTCSENVSTEPHLAAPPRSPVPVSPRSVIENRLAEWRRLLCEAHRTGRAVLEKVLVDRIVLTPMGDEGCAAGRTAPRS